MTYKVNPPVSSAVDPNAQMFLQAFFDSIPGGVDNLSPFLQSTATTVGGSASIATALYVNAELSRGLATLADFSAVAPYLVTSAAFLTALSDALVAANL